MGQFTVRYEQCYKRYKTGGGDRDEGGLLYRVVREDLFNRAETCGSDYGIMFEGRAVFFKKKDLG